MSYCVHCGVELADNVKACPLCHTPVADPATPRTEDTPFFPTAPTPIEPVSKKELALLITAMLASAGVCCGLLNLVLRAGHIWSLYVIGAAVMLWLWLVPPLVLRKMPLWVRGTLDVAAVCVYIKLIALDLHGSAWFNGMILPISVCAAVLWVGLCITGATVGRRSALSTITLVLGGSAVFLLAVEFIIDRYMNGVWQPGWSIITFTVFMAFIIPLLVVRRVPRLRTEAQRRFHL